MIRTPKPWRLIIPDWPKTVRIVGPRNQAIASFGNQQRYMNINEVIGNAMLMAMAPELLALLDEWLHEGRFWVANCDEYNDLVKRTGIAIATAKGEPTHRG